MSFEAGQHQQGVFLIRSRDRALPGTYSPPSPAAASTPAPVHAPTRTHDFPPALLLCTNPTIATGPCPYRCPAINHSVAEDLYLTASSASCVGMTDEGGTWRNNRLNLLLLFRFSRSLQLASFTGSGSGARQGGVGPRGLGFRGPRELWGRQAIYVLLCRRSGPYHGPVLPRRGSIGLRRNT